MPRSSAPPQVVNRIEPKYIRLPKTGHQCPFTGLSRSALNELVLPSERNDWKPPVKSFCLKQKKGAKTGIRLIDFQSLLTYITGNPEPAVAARN